MTPSRTALLSTLILLCGCASTPAPRYYALGGAPPPLSGKPLATNVVLTSLTIPELVDRPQLVLRSATSLVNVLDNQRWAESLKSGIARVLAADLSASLGGTPVALRSDRSERSNDAAALLVAVDISRFDASLTAGVDVDAGWSVRRGAGQSPASGTVHIHEAAGASVEEIVAAQERALARLAAEITATVRARP